MSKYIKNETKGQIIVIVFILIAIIIGLIWCEIEEWSEFKWEPAFKYPMANAHISWEQTYHSGSWGENNAGG